MRIIVLMDNEKEVDSIIWDSLDARSRLLYLMDVMKAIKKEREMIEKKIIDK